MLSEKIKELRLAAGKNQVELARELNLSKQCISNWENDNVQPSIDMLVKLADYFKVTTDYLLGLDETTYLRVDGLTRKQLMHVQCIINDIAKSNN